MGKRSTASEPPFVSPFGYGTCFCGCGGKAPVATKTEGSRGHVKGYPKRYIYGHQRRKFQPDFEENPKTGCWEWTGRLNDQGYAVGYGRSMYHRAIYEELVGSIPRGLQLHHLCEVKHCVNPGHMEPTTAGGNTQAAAKVLDWKKVREIRRRSREQGETSVAIARDLGIKVGTVRSVVSFVTWKESLCCPECGHEFDPWEYSRGIGGRPVNGKRPVG